MGPSPEISDLEAPARARASRVAARYLRRAAARLGEPRIRGARRLPPRVGTCGHAYDSSDVVLVAGPKGGHAVKGVGSCGLIWSCAVCASRRSAARQENLRKLMESHRKEGGWAYLVTLTIPHGRTDSLAVTRRLISNAWRFCQSGAPWKRAKASLGITGYCRALEVTRSGYGNGWHAHLHVLVTTSAKLPRCRTKKERKSPRGAPESVVGFRRWLYGRWARRVSSCCLGCGGRSASCGGCGPAAKTPSYRRGVRVDGGNDAAAYVAKMGLALELTAPAGKSGKGRSRSPWQILGDYSRRRRDEDARLWREWEREIKGARHLTFSRGIRERHGVPMTDRVSRDFVALATVAQYQYNRALIRNPALEIELGDALHAMDTERVAHLLGVTWESGFIFLPGFGNGLRELDPEAVRAAPPQRAPLTYGLEQYMVGDDWRYMPDPIGPKRACRRRLYQLLNHRSHYHR